MSYAVKYGLILTKLAIKINDNERNILYIEKFLKHCIINIINPEFHYKLDNFKTFHSCQKSLNPKVLRVFKDLFPHKINFRSNEVTKHFNKYFCMILM